LRYANLFNLAFSSAGLLLLLIGVCAWLLLSPRSRRAHVTLVAIVVWYTLLSINPIPDAVARYWSRGFAPLERSAVPPGRAAVVLLGSGSYTAFDWTNNRTAVPDPIGLARTLEAARVYKLIDAAWVVSSGGLPPRRSPAVSPSEAMKDTLLRLGVPASRVIVKDVALDTHDEAMNVAALLPSLHVDHVVLVTSGVHLRRATGTFRAAGIDVIPAPARGDLPGHPSWMRTYLPSQDGLFESALVGHEIFGWVYYKLKGWL
jgi:uncharacterized SAM-binding protein YcdF (DUF218 family)